MSEIPPPTTEVFRIIDRASGGVRSSYSRACHDEKDFDSVEAARNANCHGIFQNRAEFKIAKYRVIYELIEPDCDPATPEEIAEHEAIKAFRAEIEREMNAKGLVGFDRAGYYASALIKRRAWKTSPFTKLLPSSTA